MNAGNCFHEDHVLFIAPVEGLYVFSTSLLSTTYDYIQALLLKNGDKMGRIDCGQSLDYEHCSITVILELQEGDEVWIAHKDPPAGQISGYGVLSFTGFLLRYKCKT